MYNLLLKMPFIKLKVWSIQGQFLVLTINILFNSMKCPSLEVADDDREIKLCPADGIICVGSFFLVICIQINL